MSSPSRRTLLHALGAGVAATAGCVGTPDRRTSTGTGTVLTPEPTSTAAPVLAFGERHETDDGRAIEVRDAAVHPSVVTVEHVSSTHYYERVAGSGSGQQFLAFDVTVEGFDLGPDGREQIDEPIDVPLGVAVDGDRHEYAIPVGRDDEADRDRVAIRVPVGEATDAAVVWTREDGPRPRWRLPDDAVSALSAAPEFAVESWSVPDSVEYGSTFEASVTVENVGGRDGRFLATLGVNQGSLGVPEIGVGVAAGETRTRRTTIDPHYYEGADDLRVVLETPATRDDAMVEVRGGPTETGMARPTG